MVQLVSSIQCLIVEFGNLVLNFELNIYFYNSEWYQTQSHRLSLQWVEIIE